MIPQKLINEGRHYLFDLADEPADSQQPNTHGQAWRAALLLILLTAAAMGLAILRGLY